MGPFFEAYQEITAENRVRVALTNMPSVVTVHA